MTQPTDLKMAGPESQLLLACARAATAPAQGSRLRELARGVVNWEVVLDAAGYHGLQPLLCRHLVENAADAVSTPVLEQLKAGSSANARRNLLLTAEMLRLLAEFEAKGIMAVPYKGPVLATELYGNLALREFYDLDILVEARDVLPAKELLLSAGYQPVFRLTPRQERALLRAGCEYGFLSRDGGTAVEIHWRIAPRHFAVELEAGPLLARSRIISLGGARVRTLCREDLLLVLCVHGGKHLWRGLGWICDVAELLRQSGALDWPAVIARAQDMGMQRLLFLGVGLAHDLLEAPIPAEAQQAMIADRKLQPIVREVERRLWTAAPSQEFTAAEHRLLLRARERWRDRARYLLRLAATPGTAEWQSVRLPEPLFPLYPAVRLARLAGKFLHPSEAAPAPAPEIHETIGPPALRP